jgi:hypothetical protein
MPHGSYKISEAAKAAGVTAKKFKRNIDCKVIELPGPKPGKGNHHLLTLKSVYHAAIGFALTKLLVPPDIAINKLAAKFFEPQREREAGKRTHIFVSCLSVCAGHFDVICECANQGFRLSDFPWH